MPSTPLWVPLGVAVLGVLGTLAGSIFSQIWAARRDDLRWRREREAEEERWQREREERLALWDREDRERWLRDKQQMYVKVLSSLHAWTDALDRADLDVKKLEGPIDENTVKELKVLGETYSKACDPLRILGPAIVFTAASARQFDLGVFQHSLVTGKTRAHRTSDSYVALLAAIQEDLGVTDGTYFKPPARRPHESPQNDQ